MIYESFIGSQKYGSGAINLYSSLFKKLTFRKYKNSIFQIQSNMSEEVEQHILLKYELLKKIGSGAYGHVWRAIDRKTKSQVALKKIFDAFQHSTDAQRTFRQITLLHQMNHPNIIKLHNVFRAQNDKDIYLVFQCMEADLHHVVSERILQDVHNRFIVYQICKALKYLHSAELIHRDLKPSNVLLNSDCKLKVCDFGLVRCLATEKQGDNLVLTEEVATRWYRAPEVLLGSRTYDKPADMWSVGCIIAEMLIYKPIFPGNSTINQLQKILSFTGKPTQEQVASLDSELAVTMIDSVKTIRYKTLKQWFSPSVPQQAIDLVSKLLQFNPSKRLTASQALRHPYLAEFSNKKEQVSSPTVIRPPINDNKKLSLKQYRNILYDYIRRTYRDQPFMKTSVQQESRMESRHKSDSKDKNKRSVHQSDQNPNSSTYMKSPYKQLLSKYNGSGSGLISRSNLKDRNSQIKNVKEDNKRNSSYLVKKREEIAKPGTPYTSKYVKQYLSAKYEKENPKKF